MTASAGDSGYGVSYPSASRDVTSVGGTSLVTAKTTTRGWSETVWSGSGSGCSSFESKPKWQTDTGCSNRTDNDVAAVANPNTGVAIYDTYDQGGWLEVGGTSVSSPIIASVFALAGVPAATTLPVKFPYKHTSSLFDVTSGNNGSCSPAYLCTGEVGYDGPTTGGVLLRTASAVQAVSGLAPSDQFRVTPAASTRFRAGSQEFPRERGSGSIRGVRSREYPPGFPALGELKSQTLVADGSQHPRPGPLSARQADALRSNSVTGWRLLLLAYPGAGERARRVRSWLRPLPNRSICRAASCCEPK